MTLPKFVDGSMYVVIIGVLVKLLPVLAAILPVIYWFIKIYKEVKRK